MQILIPDSWLRKYLTTNASPKDIQRCLSLCGPSIERLHQLKDDTVYDIEVTSNRPDLMSVIGIASEANAILPQFGFTAKFSEPYFPPIPKQPPVDINFINNEKLCHRIVAFKVENVTIAPSPADISAHLESVGQRPLNNLVDLTNYVMWEIGHPAHVFDYDRLTTKKMVIRQAKKGEKLITLDKKSHTLLGGEVVIDDGTGNIIDLPCIMGTDNSVVTGDTSTALFFIEDIDPVLVRKASMDLGIRTQAAVLKEKDVDSNLSMDTAQRLIQLIKKILPNAKISGFTDIYPHPFTSKPVTVEYSQIDQLIGVHVPPKTIHSILERLNFKITSNTKSITVLPPTWRAADIQIPQDVIEEIARIYGYFNMPSVLMTGQIPKPSDTSSFLWESKLKYALFHWGFTESYTYSLVSKNLVDSNALKLTNPLSEEWAYLRTGLTASHLQLITENVGKSSELNFFEIANVYLPKSGDLPLEELHLIITTTNKNPLFLKGIAQGLVEKIAGLPPQSISYEIIEHQNPACFTWETNLSKIIPQANSRRLYRPISKFSPIIEDVNFKLDGPYDELVSKLKSISPLIQNIELIDRFSDKITLRFTFHSDTKQLSTQDIAPLRDKISNS